ncbi:hypothetical protein [Brevundimonas sp.]|uniref:hypothetical protein n=1 Tax=Brevundimonas sp. TaxID=1871086 RepID=UPI0035623FE8
MATDIESAILETPDKFDEQDCVDPSDLSAQYEVDMDARRPQWLKNMLSIRYHRSGENDIH